MRLTYLDESGDDGVAPGSSPLFVLAGVSLEGARWREMRREIRLLRGKWAQRLGLPEDVELHTRALMLGKRPYSDLGVRREAGREVMADLAELIAQGGLSAGCHIVDKSGAPGGVLHRSLSALVDEGRGTHRMYLSDRGRVPAMRRILAEEISDEQVVESIVELDSATSPFIQLADALATAAHVAWSARLGLPSHARLREEDREAAIFLAEGPNRKCFLVRP